MKTSSRLKAALLAGAALTMATTVSHAADRPPIEPARIEHAATLADHGGDEAAAPSSPARKWAIAGFAAAALAGVARLIGWRRIRAAAQAAGPAVANAAKAVASGTSELVRAVGSAIISPIRLAVLAAGLALVALTGIGLYDIEWAAGLVFGALVTLSVMIGAGKARKALSVWRSTARP